MEREMRNNGRGQAPNGKRRKGAGRRRRQRRKLIFMLVVVVLAICCLAFAFVWNKYGIRSGIRH